MKHLSFSLVLCSFFSYAVLPETVDHTLGKTHFIVGYDHSQLPKLPDEPVCVYDETTTMFFCADGTIKQAFFSPDDDLAKLLVSLIGQEKLSIKAAIFSFTDADIAQALIDAHKKGVKVEIITDISGLRDRFNKIESLKENGITLYVYNPVNKAMLNDIMHNKFVLFGKNIHNKPLLWTGSFNFTKSAKLKNQENVLILDEKHLIEKYNQQFERIKKRITHPADASVKVAKKTVRTKKKQRGQPQELVVIS